MTINDNVPTIQASVFPAPDAHGLAALLLVESLIHGLCEKGTLTVNEAVEIAESAIEVQFDQAEEADGAGAPMWRSHALLLAIAASLRIDGDDTPAPPRLVT